MNAHSNPRLPLIGCLLLFLASLLMGCAGQPVIAPPQIVKVTQTRYIQIPAGDTQPCTLPSDKPVTNSDLLQHDQAAMRGALCDEAQLQKIRNESGKAPPVKP